MKKVLRYISEQGFYSLFLFFADRLRNEIGTRLILKRWHLRNIYIGPRSIIRGAQKISLGENFYAKDMLWLDAIMRYGDQQFSPTIKIGKNVSISRNVHIAAISQVTIDDGVMIGSNVLITDHSHGSLADELSLIKMRSPAQRPLLSKGEIKIGKDVWIGEGVVILAGISIGHGAVIGANSIVTKNVPDRTTVGGIPARKIS
ncbi:acyltransferase [Janthinobacterium sp. RB2R34]|uniref:acyltransferase n=1 Tax=Janthinobacterium sp. RB2R34 TaxID=3424193 RepID=UPI003F22BE33